MHGPINATKINENPGHLPGLCQSECEICKKDGFFIPYFMIKRHKIEKSTLIDCQVKIILSVKENTSLRGEYQSIPFIIDTGSPLTVIPRKLVKKDFPKEKALGGKPFYMFTVAGEKVTGQFFKSLIAIPQKKKSNWFCFSGRYYFYRRCV